MLSWNFLVNGFVIRAILSIMGMAMDARHIFSYRGSDIWLPYLSLAVS